MNEISFGEQLKSYRETHHLTQAELGKLLELSDGYVSLLERNLKHPRTTTVLRFRRLRNDDNWDPYEILKELSDEEFAAYMSLWQRMKRLGPKMEKEVMIVFLRILNLT